MAIKISVLRTFYIIRCKTVGYRFAKKRFGTGKNPRKRKSYGLGGVWKSGNGNLHCLIFINPNLLFIIINTNI